MEYIPYILDALIFILPIVTLIVGYARGFTGLALPFVFTVLALVIARLYAAPFAEYLTEHYVHDYAAQRLASFLGEKVTEGFVDLTSALPSEAVELLKNSGIASSASLAEQSIPSFCESAVTAAEPVFIIPVVTVCVYIAFYFFSKLLSALLIKPAKLIARLPVIKQVNRFFGALFGALLGILRLGAYVAVMAVILRIFPSGSFAALISQTKTLTFLINKLFELF